MGNALWDNHPAIAAVEIGALDRAIVEIGHAHVGPIDMASLRIHGDSVRQMATGNDGLLSDPSGFITWMLPALSSRTNRRPAAAWTGDVGRGFVS